MKIKGLDNDYGVPRVVDICDYDLVKQLGEQGYYFRCYECDSTQLLQEKKNKPPQKECSCNPHGYPHASAIQKDEDGNEICMWCKKELNPAKPIPEKNECTCQIGTGLNGICIMCGKPDNTGNRGTTYYGFFKTKPISHRKVEQIKYNDDLYKDGNIQMCIDKLNEVISVINGGGE